MSGLRIETAEVFAPLLEQARDRAAFGGRGSGKSHFFAESLVEDALRFPGEAQEGLRTICGREIQKSLKDSAKFLIESKIKKLGLGEADGFKIYTDRIATPGDGVFVFQGLQDHTTDSIKSFEGFHKFWGEEAHTISTRSLGLIRPTMRWENARLGLISEMLWSWNPRRKTDAVDALLRGPSTPTGAIVVRANWSDNPWFPNVLEQERQDCLRLTPDQYDHIWEGGYATVLEGAYYAKHLAEARQQGRIGKVERDPLMTLRAVWDIGGTGRKADATAIWICQFVGKEIRFLDYYEAVGQPLEAHVNWLRSNGYEKALCVIPHDGVQGDKVFDVSYESALQAAGFETLLVKNQGKGAALLRVEAARRLFPNMWFNEQRCAAGIEAVGWYHEKKHEVHNVGLGPEHDWSSHGADAFGLACVAYEEPKSKRPKVKRDKRWIV